MSTSPTSRTSSSASAFKNRDIVGFIVKGLGTYIAWYILYEAWLGPQGHVDEWLAKELAVASAGLLNLLGWDAWVNGRVLGLVGMPGVDLVDGCTGLSAIGLFFGFIVAYPGRWIHRAWFLPVGVLVVHGVNILRIASLVVVQQELPSLWDPVKGYVFPAAYYLAIFMLWFVWMEMHERLAPQTSSQKRDEA